MLGSLLNIIKANDSDDWIVLEIVTFSQFKLIGNSTVENNVEPDSKILIAVGLFGLYMYNSARYVFPISAGIGGVCTTCTPFVDDVVIAFMDLSPFTENSVDDDIVIVSLKVFILLVFDK